MSDSPQYEAFRQFARATIELEVVKATHPLREEIRSLRAQSLETRSAAPSTGPAGPAGKDGSDGKDGRDGKDGERGEKGERGPEGARGVDGVAGRDGAPSTVPGPRGEPGERGADGIATFADVDARIEARFADLQVRTLADVYQGVFETERDRPYTRGQLTTWGGSLWLSLNDTRSNPGENRDWKLVAKRGADGKNK